MSQLSDTAVNNRVEQVDYYTINNYNTFNSILKDKPFKYNDLLLLTTAIKNENLKFIIDLYINNLLSIDLLVDKKKLIYLPNYKCIVKLCIKYNYIDELKYIHDLVLYYVKSEYILELDIHNLDLDNLDIFINFKYTLANLYLSLIDVHNKEFLDYCLVLFNKNFIKFDKNTKKTIEIIIYKCISMMDKESLNIVYRLINTKKIHNSILFILYKTNNLEWYKYVTKLFNCKPNIYIFNNLSNYIKTIDYEFFCYLVDEIKFTSLEKQTISVINDDIIKLINKADKLNLPNIKTYLVNNILPQL
jgi:hypothetical protein